MSTVRAWAFAAVVAASACACAEPAGSAFTTGRDATPQRRDRSGPGAWPPAAPRIGFGRGVAPQRAARGDIAGAQRTPLNVTRVVQVAGDGPALAVVEGTLGSVRTHTIELIDIDRGEVRWRNDRDCAGGVVHAHVTGIVCNGAPGTTALDLGTGALRWSDVHPPVLADLAGALARAGDRELVSIDPTGVVAAPITLPPGVRAADVRARCGDELWAASDGRVHRIVDGELRWSTLVGDVQVIEPCDRIVVVAISPPLAPPRAEPGRRTRSRPRPRSRRGRARPPPADVAPGPTDAKAPVPLPIALTDRAPTEAVIAVDRDTGRIIGGPVLARGHWPARDGSSDLELATAAGIEQRRRDLSPGRLLPGSPVAGALLAARGDRVLVAGATATAVLGPRASRDAPILFVLDRRGVRAHLAGPTTSAALGDDFLLAAGPALARLAVPLSRPSRRAVAPTAAPHPPVHRAELPDARALDAVASVTDVAATAIVRVLVDPADAAVWVLAARGALPAIVARLDLRTRAWQIFDDACPDDAAVGLAATGAAIVCASRTGSVRGVGRDGHRAWDWTPPPAATDPDRDELTATATAIVITRADRTVWLDAATGAVLDAHRTDDGRSAAAVAVQVGAASAIAVVERGAIVTRARDAPLAPLWATAPRGAVTGLAAGAADLVVLLDTGDAYRLDLATGAASALSAAADRWSIAGDLVIGETARDDTRVLRGFDGSGERFRTALTLASGAPVALAARGTDPDAPVAIVHDLPPRVVVLDPRTGRVVRHLALPGGATAEGVFATVVDGRPVVGAVLTGPLAAALF